MSKAPQSDNSDILESLMVAFRLLCSDCDAVFQVNVLTFKVCFVIASRNLHVF